MSQREYLRKNARTASLTVSSRSAARSFAASHNSRSTRMVRAGLSLRGWSGIAVGLADRLGDDGQRAVRVATLDPVSGTDAR